MVAVGLWGAFLGPPAMWVLPVVFPLVMSIGGALGVLGVPLPGTETGIALSSLVLGLMVAIPTLIIHSFLSHRTQDRLSLLERYTTEFVASAEQSRGAALAAGSPQP